MDGDVFYIVLVLSALIAAELGAILHRSYSNEHLLLGSRYVPTSAVLWVGAVLYAVRRVRLPAAVVLAAALFYFGYGIYFADKADRKFIAAMREARHLFSAGVYEPGWLRFVFPDEKQSRDIIDLARRHGAE